MATGVKISGMASVTRLNAGDLGTCVQSGVNKNYDVGSVTAKAWISFVGTGTISVRDSYNVASILDLGVGNYSVTFTSAMADGNYPAVLSVRGSSTSVSFGSVSPSVSPTSSVLTIVSANASTLTLVDVDIMNVTVFGS